MNCARLKNEACTKLTRFTHDDTFDLTVPNLCETNPKQHFFYFFFSQQNKNKENTNSNIATPTTSDAEQTSISLSNDTESIKKQEPKTQVNIVISYIEKNDEQGIGQLVMQAAISTSFNGIFGIIWFRALRRRL